MTKNAWQLENFSTTVSKRPLMFLPTKYVGQVLTPSSMVESFLQLILNSECFHSTSDIRLNAVGAHFTFHANHCSFNLSNLTKENNRSGDENLVEWILSKILPLQEGNEDYAAFVQLIALVCLSDTCQLDISFDTEIHFRQMFFKGKPVSNGNLFLGDELPKLFPYIRLSLTPRRDIFSVTYEEFAQTLNVIDECLNGNELGKLDLIRTINRKESNDFEISIYRSDAANKII